MSDLNQFVTDAIRTESQIETVTVNLEMLASVMAISIASGNMLDQIKKHVFYGKDYNKDGLVADFKDILESLGALKETPLFRTEETDDLEEIDLGVNPRLFHAMVGIATESTELLEALDLSGEVVDAVNVGEELGDLDWYKAIACDELNISWDDVLTTVIAKLRSRYPDKFDSDNAINRDLEQEREILNDLETKEAGC